MSDHPSCPSVLQEVRRVWRRGCAEAGHHAVSLPVLQRLAEEAKAPAARLCKTPVTHLLLDAVLMKRVDGGHAAVSVPLCDMCEEDEATKVLQRLPEEQAVLRPLLCCLAPEEARSHYRSDPRAPRLGTGPRGWR